jgi:hypothetical protein
MPAILTALPAATLVGDYLALATVGAVSRHRTAGVRRGRQDGPGDRAPPPGGRTSRATYLPGLAGALLVATVAVARPPPALLATLVGAGAFVAVTGLRGRVRAIEVRPGGLAIHHAAGASFDLPWDRCARLRPPRAPWGGWLLARDDGARRTLMPSDLLGKEAVLEAVVVGSGLRFDGRAWRRPTAPVSPTVRRTRTAPGRVRPNPR